MNAVDTRQVEKIYKNVVEQAMTTVGGRTAWTNFTIRIHRALVNDQIMWWIMQQDDSVSSDRVRFLAQELWHRMMGDEEL